ncbi:restriction endonuclease subunit S [Streptococcus suis]
MRLRSISQRINYGYTASAESKGNAKFLRITDIQNGKVNWNRVPYCSISREKLDNYILYPGDIVIARTGGTIGKSFLIEQVEHTSVYASYLIRLQLFPKIEKYIKIFLESNFYWQQLSDVSMGTGQSNVNGTNLSNLIIPLPPLAEQKRIVAQIEHALEKVEVYAESYNKLQELDKAFPDKLKKSILQYAMQGKLVAQDPNDEPVEVLLEKIRAEKQKLYEEGKLKKKDLAEIMVEKGDDNSPYQDVPYDIPESWKWVRLDRVASLNFFPNISGDKIPNCSWVLDMEDIEKETGKLVRKNYKTEKSSYKSNKVSFSQKAVLYAKLRPNLKKVIVADEDGFATTELLPIKLFGNILPEYIKYCMVTPFYYFNIIQSVYGVKMPRVNSTFLSSTLIPLPPLAEQKRIVSKISKIFSVIETLV